LLLGHRQRPHPAHAVRDRRAATGAEIASGSAVLSMARPLASAFGVAVLVAVVGGEDTATLPGLRRAFAIVLFTAALTAAAGSRGGAERRVSVAARAPLRLR